MHHCTITAMLKALRPALKNRKQAQQILERFWSDMIAILWDEQDVHGAANERDVALTKTEALKVLHKLHDNHDPQLGLRWADFTSYIEDCCLGRPLTKRELKRFV